MRKKDKVGNRRVLALNSVCIPVDFKDPKDAFRILCKGNAYIFDVNWMRYTLDEWIIEHLEKKNGGLALGDFDGEVNTVNFEIPIPPVIILQYYETVRPLQINPTKENIWKRDGAACAYCKKTLKLEEVTLDHIHPRSKGGSSAWFNLAASCQECNCKKDDELLQDIHDMELSIEPFVPKRTSILYCLGVAEVENMPDFWKHFFVEFK